MNRRIVLLLAFACTSSFAGELADTLAPGVRGLQWERCAPEAALPKGRWKSEFGATYFSVSDSSPLFGVVRAGKQEIQVVCDAARSRVTSITFSFPGTPQAYGDLVKNLTENFGRPSEPQGDEHASSVAAVADIRRDWTDDKFRISLVHAVVGLDTKTFVTISHDSPSSQGRAALGLD